MLPKSTKILAQDVVPVLKSLAASNLASDNTFLPVILNGIVNTYEDFTPQHAVDCLDSWVKLKLHDPIVFMYVVKAVAKNAASFDVEEAVLCMKNMVALGVTRESDSFKTVLAAIARTSNDLNADNTCFCLEVFCSLEISDDIVLNRVLFAAMKYSIELDYKISFFCLNALYSSKWLDNLELVHFVLRSVLNHSDKFNSSVASFCLFFLTMLPVTVSEYFQHAVLKTVCNNVSKLCLDEVVTCLHYCSILNLKGDVNQLLLESVLDSWQDLNADDVTRCLRSFVTLGIHENLEDIYKSLLKNSEQLNSAQAIQCLISLTELKNSSVVVSVLDAILRTVANLTVANAVKCLRCISILNIKHNVLPHVLRVINESSASLSASNVSECFLSLDILKIYDLNLGRNLLVAFSNNNNSKYFNSEEATICLCYFRGLYYVGIEVQSSVLKVGECLSENLSPSDAVNCLVSLAILNIKDKSFLQPVLDAICKSSVSLSSSNITDCLVSLAELNVVDNVSLLEALLNEFSNESKCFSIKDVEKCVHSLKKLGVKRDLYSSIGAFSKRDTAELKTGVLNKPNLSPIERTDALVPSLFSNVQDVIESLGRLTHRGIKNGLCLQPYLDAINQVYDKFDARDAAFCLETVRKLDIVDEVVLGNVLEAIRVNAANLNATETAIVIQNIALLGLSLSNFNFVLPCVFEAVIRNAEKMNVYAAVICLCSLVELNVSLETILPILGPVLTSFKFSIISNFKLNLSKGTILWSLAELNIMQEFDLQPFIVALNSFASTTDFISGLRSFRKSVKVNCVPIEIIDLTDD